MTFLILSFPKYLIGNLVLIETISPIEAFGDDNLNANWKVISGQRPP
jgi:hypothetical protein